MIDLYLQTEDETIQKFLFKEFASKIHFKLNEPTTIYGDNWSIIDTRYITNNELANALKHHAPKIILLTHQCDEYNVHQFLDKYSLNNLIGVNSDNLSTELIQTLENILFNSKLPLVTDFPQSIQTEIQNSSKIVGVIDEMLKEFNLSSFFDSPVEYLRLIGNELITNALYNAANGDDQSRKEEIKLNNGQEIQCSIGMNDSFIGITVTDKFGTLTRDKIVGNLSRSFKTKEFEEKNGGAGLGLYLVFSHSNALIVRLSKGKKTEVTCLIDKNKRYKKYKSRITSFHFYEEV